MSNALTIKNLCKTYHNGVKALKDVSLSIDEGSFFALLGPNGAGKSTLINILATLIQKTTGQIWLGEVDVSHQMALLKKELGIMPQEINLGVFEKVSEIILNQAGYYGIPRRQATQRMDMLLDALDLSDKKHSLVRNLSGGMKRRVMIARALIHDPKIVILDEPTAGVDIELRQKIWSFFQALNKEGKTIILTTHYLEEAEQLCDHLAIINQGTLSATSDMPTLLREIQRESFILYLDNSVKEPLNIPQLTLDQLDSKTLEVEVPKGYPISRLIGELLERGIHVNRIRNKSNRLENIFLKMTCEANSP